MLTGCLSTLGVCPEYTFLSVPSTQVWRTKADVRFVVGVFHFFGKKNLNSLSYRHLGLHKNPSGDSLCGHLCAAVLSRVPPPLPGIFQLDVLIRGQKSKAACVSTMIAMVSHIVHDLLVDLWGENKSSSLEQRVAAAAGRCICRLPTSPAPEPSSPTL